jgi:hypothetical protein
MLKIGDTINEWLSPYYEIDTKGCCNLIATLNAYGPISTRLYLKSVTVLVMHELKIDYSKAPLVKLLLATAIKRVERAKKNL